MRNPPQRAMCLSPVHRHLSVAVRQALYVSVLATGTAQAGPFPTVFDLAALDGTNGFVLNGTESGDLAGFSVDRLGDFNGDGEVDFIIGAQGADPMGNEQAGIIYVVFGGLETGPADVVDLVSLNQTTGLVIHGGVPDGLPDGKVNDGAGISVSGAGDVNGDGYDDAVIGAFYADPNDRFQAGQGYVVFGGPNTPAVIALADLDGSNGFMMNGRHKRGTAGRVVSEAGDINGDGYGDVIVGAHWADPNGKIDGGQSYVVFGGPFAGVLQ